MSSPTPSKRLRVVLRSMDYELAKELKDAGFPQKYKHDDLRCMSTQGLGCHCRVDVPTLSELIEACWKIKGFHYILKENDGEWSIETYGLPEKLVCKGSSPLEAVARLWLALNTKST